MIITEKSELRDELCNEFENLRSVFIGEAGRTVNLSVLLADRADHGFLVLRKIASKQDNIINVNGTAAVHIAG